MKFASCFGRMAHPTQKRLPPFRGKLSAARLTDEGAHGNDAPLVRPLIRHLLCKCHLPPRGKVQRVRDAPPYMVCALRRGRCPHRPAGGHMGPPLRVLTDGADRRPLIRPYGPPSPPVGGRQRAAEGGGPYEGRRGQSSTPSVSLRSTFPPDRGNRPSSEGAKEKSLPLTREVAFAEQMTEGETERRGQAPAYIIRTIRRGAQRRPPRHSEAPEGPWESVLSHVG